MSPIKDKYADEITSNTIELTATAHGFEIKKYNKFRGSTFIKLNHEEMEHLVKEYNEVKGIYGNRN